MYSFIFASVNKPFKSKSTKANKTKASNSHRQREDVPQRREPEPEQGGKFLFLNIYLSHLLIQTFHCQWPVLVEFVNRVDES